MMKVRKCVKHRPRVYIIYKAEFEGRKVIVRVLGRSVVLLEESGKCLAVL